MSTVRLSFFLVLAIAGTVWASLALYAHAVRLQHKDVVVAIRAEATEAAEAPAPLALDKAIESYANAVQILPCKMLLHQDLGLLLAYRTDTALASSDVALTGTALDAMQEALGALLSCTPMDGKAWLDLAMINTYREGFTKRSVAAYTMSQTVAPGESWLAEKRLLFALQFKPLLDPETLENVEKDIVVLERAHPNKMTAVMDAAAVKTPKELRAVFSRSDVAVPSVTPSAP